MSDDIRRRRVVQSIGAVGAAVLAGCSSDGGGGSPENESSGTTPANGSTSDEPGRSTDDSHPQNAWPRYGSDAGETNASPGPAPVAESFEEAWRIENVASAQPVADSEYLYVHAGESIRCIGYDGDLEWEVSAGSASNLMRYDDTLAYFGDGVYYLLDATNGDRIASLQTEGPLSLDTFTFHEGLLVTGMDELGLGDPWLAATDVESGEERWRVTVPAPKSGVVVGDVVLATDQNAIGAYDLENGSARWETEHDAIGPVMTADEHGAFGTLSGGVLSPTELFAHEVDSPERRWRRGLPAEESVIDLALDEEALYVIQSHAVSALDRETGETNWSFNATGEITGNPLLTPSALYLHEEELIEIVDPEAGEQQQVIGTESLLGTEDPPVWYDMIPAHGRLYVGLAAALHDDPLLALDAPA
ncbi:outer membrane protein assembly factor BamB family protein [Salinarchaeum laminariae]|uniref:outer membrane protein assembly factor BamB family protein n=1 Tax=Salinarchaeum laminariae TaxID=869888 RepID=UPI0020C1686C|nr:PQQ-binding-like beta-propeller repeat protein [Salinarchaeum laminariae]